MSRFSWIVFFSYIVFSVDSIEPSCNPQYDILKTIVKLEHKMEKMEDVITRQQNVINKLSNRGK